MLTKDCIIDGWKAALALSPRSCAGEPPPLLSAASLAQPPASAEGSPSQGRTKCAGRTPALAGTVQAEPPLTPPLQSANCKDT